MTSQHKFPRLAAVCATLALVAAVLTGGLFPSLLPGAAAQGGSSIFVRKISLRANDVVFSASTNMLYVSVPSSAGAGGNTVTPVNPANGAAGAPVFMGSEPNQLALSSDGNTLYAALDGASAIRPLDLQTQTPGTAFSLGNEHFFGPLTVADLAVAPGAPQTVAVARAYQGISPPEAGVAIYDSGVRRTQTGPGHSAGADSLAFSDTVTTLYGGGGGFNGNRLLTMTLDATGVTTPITESSFGVGTKIKYGGGKIFSSGGQVVSPAGGGALLGTLPSANSFAFAPEADGARAYYLVRESFGSSSFTLKAFDTNTFLLLGSQTVTGVTGDPTEMVRWGANGLAFRTSTGELFIIQTSLIPSTEPVPTPTPVVSPTPTPTPVVPATFVRKVNLPAGDIAYNPSSQLLHVSVGSAAGAGGNSIVNLDPANGTTSAPVFVGSEPGRLALADDNRTLHVFLQGARAVRRYDTQTQTPGAQFSVQSSLGDIQTPADMEAVPGSPNSVAISPGVNFSTGVTIFDDGVQRPNVGKSNNNGSFYAVLPIEFGASASVLYGYDNYSSGFELVKFNVDAQGVTTAQVTNNLISGYNADIEYASGLIYSSTGRIVDPEAKRLIGTFTESGGVFAIDTALRRAFFVLGDPFSSSARTLKVYDLDTFLPLGSVQLPNITGAPTRLVRWGANGLALRTANTGFGSSEPNNAGVYLIQSALVSNAQPVPTGVGFAFSPSTLNVSEFSQTLQVAVSRTGELSGTTTVNYSTSDGTATAPADYTAASGTLTFAPGETSKNISVAIKSDNVYEGNETFNITLGTLSAGAVLSGSANLPVTILDSSSRPSIHVLDASVTEGDSGTSELQFIVNLSNPSTETVTVNYATASDTATAPGDFTSASGTLTFAPLATTATVKVQVNGDTQIEPDEKLTLNLSGAVNSPFISRAQANGTIIDDDGKSLIELTASAHTVNEADGQLRITVRRTGALASSVSVAYSTFSQFNSLPPALPFGDFTQAVGVLRFGPNETEKSFNILITNDAFVEPDETFGVALNSPSAGAALGARPSANILLKSDDAVDGPSPVSPAGFNSQFFARQHYHDFFNRQPDASGLAFWSNQASNCGNPVPQVCRDNVSGAFFLSIEFQETGYLVYRAHKAAYGNLPSLNWPVTMPNLLSDMGQIAEGFIIPEDGWEERLAQNKTAYFDAFVQTGRFLQRYPQSLTPEQYVTLLNQSASAGLGVSVLSTAERDDLIAKLAGGQLTRARVLRAVAEDPTLGDAEYRRAFVYMQYVGYLRRDPDTSGFNFWLTKLNNHNGDYISSEMIRSFIVSGEYMSRFGR